jgi:syntaxin 1B/2/3
MVDIEKAKQAANQIEARHRDITKVETSVKELHDMFVELAILVTTQVCIRFFFRRFSSSVFCHQGEMIDNIGYNVNKTKTDVEHAAVEVKKTVTSDRNTRKVNSFFFKLQKTFFLFYRKKFVYVLF